MHKLSSFVLKSGAVLSTSMLSIAAFAQSTTPTTAVGLAQTVNMDDAKSAGLIIVGLLITVGVVLWGARLVMSKFAPKL
jgi:hypothetical protein